MPRSSRHKSRRQSKHSSRDCSDSEDAAKMNEKSSKDDGSTRVHRESASGGKRKISSLFREGKEISGHENGDAVEGYFLSKWRKEKTDVSVGDDRWDGGGEERECGERHLEKELHKGEILKLDTLKESSSKGESLRVESKSKSGGHDSGIPSERKYNSLVFVVVEKKESKAKGESKRKSERDSSLRKEGKESKDKERRSEKEKNGGQESKIGDAGVKLVGMDVGKKEGTQLVDLCEERQSKRYRENNDRNSLDKDMDNKIRKNRRGSGESAKYYDEPKESEGKPVSSKGDRAKDLKHRDDKYQEDDRRRDAKYGEEADNGKKHFNVKYQEDGERDSRHRDHRHKDEKYREDIERNIRYKDREKRSRDSKYRGDELDRTGAGDVSDTKRSREDGYAADHRNKVSRRDDEDSPSRDDRATRYQDDQGRRRSNEKEDYNDVKSRVWKDQMSDAEKKSVSSGRTSGHARRWSSPTSSSHALMDNYRSVKQDDSKYRDYNYENRSQHKMNSTRDYYPGPLGGSERTSSSRGEEVVPVPPPFRNNGVDSTCLSGTSDKRMGDHNNIGLMQGNNINAWRGVPGWLPNGFMPFPHASPFPFHTPSIPLHMPPDTNMFSGPGRSCLPMFHNAIYGDESRMYGRSERWEMSPCDKWNNNSIPSEEEDGALAVHQTHQNEHVQVNHKSDSINDVSQSTKNEIGDSTIFTCGVSGDGAMKNDTPFCRFYLSKLDISEKLAESEFYDKCMGLSDTDTDIDDSKILYMEGPEDKMTLSGLLRFPLFASTDDSVFKKSMSLYKIQKESLMAEYGEKPKVMIPNSDEDENVQGDQSEKHCLTDDVQMNKKEGSVVKDGATCINDELDTNFYVLVNLSRIHDSPGKSTL